MNKKIFITFFSSLMVLFVSCKKETKEKINCILDTSDMPGEHDLQGGELEKALRLMTLNGIDAGVYHIFKLQEISITGGHLVRCKPFSNNLKIFTDETHFQFDSSNILVRTRGDFRDLSGMPTGKNMRERDVKSVYIQALEEDEAYRGSKLFIKKGCLQYEFGYYDLNASRGITEETFVRAWHIKPALGGPEAYVNDESGELIYYDNGIRY